MFAAVGFVLTAAVSVEAKVVLPHIFGDNMVLQQQTDVKIWGTANPSSKVVITPSWDSNASVTVKSGKDGKWTATLSTPEAGGPYTVTLSDGETLELNNVMTGEVWFCSGQSNMEMPMKGFTTQPVEGAADVIMRAKTSTPIRVCMVKKAAEFTPQDDCDASWSENTPEVVANTSATAYYFARYIQDVLEVPVGIIVSSWGGSSMEAWMDRETVSSEFPEFDLSFIDKEEMPKNKHQVPTLLYNGMLHPVIPFTVKGIIWYQGEQNRRNPEQYLRLQPSFAKMFREQWGLGDIPFYYVQIAPFNYSGDDSAYLREAQMKALELIPNSGMAVTLDIGDVTCIHPAKKQQVGERLAYLALTQTYGRKGIDPYSPIYKSWEVKDGKALVYFNVGADGLAPLGPELDGFEVARADRIFHPATAKVIRNGKIVNMVEVSCPEVADPAAVRYGFHNDSVGTLYNNYGIPASSFRTDDWE